MLDVVLHYDNGSQARAPVRFGADVLPWIDRPQAPAHAAWMAPLPDSEFSFGAPSMFLYRVRAVNPHPERPVISLDFEALPVTWNAIAVIAASLEPLPGDAHAPSTTAGTRPSR
jgi:hypothetical protein